MIVVGIDTSCDDTSVAVYDAKRGKVLSNLVSSQFELHAPFGGVVPEVAARRHAEQIDLIFQSALKEAGVELPQVGLVAATNRPGLLPALLVGLTFGKGVSFAAQKPFKAVHHIEAHLLSPFIGREPPFPFLGLVVSGGHTLIVWAEGLGNYKVLGKTLDDAVGESFDKVAKLLKLGYPGGPIIDRLFKEYRGEYLQLPKPKVKGLNTSFSGIKTATRKLIEAGHDPKQVAASFQKTAIEYLVGKVKKALRETGAKRLAVSGGVSANSLLREKLKELQSELKFELHLCPLNYTNDNGAMVAYAGYLRFLKEGPSPLTVGAQARSSLEEG